MDKQIITKPETNKTSSAHSNNPKKEISNLKENATMKTLSRAFKNISRRKTRPILVVIAFGFIIEILIVAPLSIATNQAATNSLTNILGTQFWKKFNSNISN